MLINHFKEGEWLRQIGAWREELPFLKHLYLMKVSKAQQMRWGAHPESHFWSYEWAVQKEDSLCLVSTRHSDQTFNFNTTDMFEAVQLHWQRNFLGPAMAEASGQLAWAFDSKSSPHARRKRPGSTYQWVGLDQKRGVLKCSLWGVAFALQYRVNTDCFIPHVKDLSGRVHAGNSSSAKYLPIEIDRMFRAHDLAG